METNIIHNKDCFESLEELDDNSIDCIVTDPPYGVLKGTSDGKKVEDGFSQNNIDKLMKEYYRVLKDNSFLLFFGQQPTLTSWNYEAMKLFRYKQEVIWYKKDGSPLQQIVRTHENIMLFTKGSKKINKIYRPFSDVMGDSVSEFKGAKTLLTYISKISGIINNKEKLQNCIRALEGDKSLYSTESRINSNAMGSDKRMRHRYINDYLTVSKGYSPSSVVGFRPHNKQKFNHGKQKNGKEEHNIKHPTVKPIQLLEYLIDLTTDKKDVVLDTFVGSGTTAVACINLDRRYIGCELDKDYYKIAIDRVNKAKIDLNKEELKGSEDEVNAEWNEHKKDSLFD